MKKVFVFIVIFLLVVLPSSVFAYSVPDDCYFIDCQTTELGRITIYIPSNMSKYFSDSGSSFINTYSSTITGYANVSGNEYTFRFQTFQLPEYRYYSGNYSNYAPLTITEIYSSNLRFLDETDFLKYPQSDMFNLIFLCIGGFIVCLLFMKKF